MSIRLEIRTKFVPKIGPRLSRCWLQWTGWCTGLTGWLCCRMADAYYAVADENISNAILTDLNYNSGLCQTVILNQRTRQYANNRLSTNCAKKYYTYRFQSREYRISFHTFSHLNWFLYLFFTCMFVVPHETTAKSSFGLVISAVSRDILIYLLICYRVALLSLGQLCDWLSVGETTLNVKEDTNDQ